MTSGSRPDDISLRAVEDAFRAALHDEARPRFEGDATLGATLVRLRDAAIAAYPDIVVDAVTFAGELARRLAAAASPEQLARVRADHIHLAILAARNIDPGAARERIEGERDPLRLDRWITRAATASTLAEVPDG